MDAPSDAHDEHLSRHERLRQKAEEFARFKAERDAADTARSRKRRARWMVIGVLALALAGFLVVRQVIAPGPYDSFAKCLSEKGAVMYGAIEWCSYTKQQAGMFGKSFKYVTYADYKGLDGIQKTPTWVVNGERYPGVQSFERLAALTGCEV